MAVSKKDFVAIARSINNAAPAAGMPDEWRAGCASARRYIAEQLCVEFARSNPCFKPDLFRQACGLGSDS